MTTEDIIIPTLFGAQATIVRGIAETVKKSVAERDTRPYALTDALFAGDKRTLWIQYRTLIRDGYTPDELAITLWWGIKSILQVYSADSSVSPYVTKKISVLQKKMNQAGAVTMALAFLESITSARTTTGGIGAESYIERWILELSL